MCYIIYVYLSMCTFRTESSGIGSRSFFTTNRFVDDKASRGDLFASAHLMNLDEGGSILGDKTRMAELSKMDDAFVRCVRT